MHIVFSTLARVALPSILFATTIHAEAYINYGALGPTPVSAKSNICNVLDYGGIADGETDIGPAIASAYSSCVTNGNSTLYIPPGNYSLATGVKMRGHSGWAMQIDGLITLTSDGGFNGNAFIIQEAQDFELFSSNGQGAINGQGYIARRDGTGQNARLVRLIDVTDVSVHDLILVDAPAFHLVLGGVTNAEIYYLTIRGGDIGATDGIDLTCYDNCWVHDFEVSNRDECVSVKSPSQNVLIEEAYCNHSGGMSIGSLTAAVDSPEAGPTVFNITMRNVYVYKNTQMLMIKTYPGGDGAMGYVKDCLFENFWGFDTTYALDINQYWQSTYDGDTGGVALSSLIFRNWTGSLNNGAQRGAVYITGSSQVPLQHITIEGFNMWTANGNRVVNKCGNVYGSGECIAASSGTTTYATAITTWASPTDWIAPASPTWGVEGYGTTDPIPVYAPTPLWPTTSSSSISATIAKAEVKSLFTSTPSPSILTTNSTSSFEASSTSPVASKITSDIPAASSSVILETTYNSTSSSAELVTPTPSTAVEDSYSPSSSTDATATNKPHSPEQHFHHHHHHHHVGHNNHRIGDSGRHH